MTLPEAIALLGAGVFCGVIIVLALRAHGARATASVNDHICAHCSHFDLDEGQAALRQNPVFVRVMESISPHEQSKRIVGYEDVDCSACVEDGKVNPECGFCHGKGQVVRTKYSEASLPLKAKWSEFGACTCPELNTGEDSGHVCWSGGGKDCEHWRSNIVPIRRKSAA